MSGETEFGASVILEVGKLILRIIIIIELYLRCKTAEILHSKVDAHVMMILFHIRFEIVECRSVLSQEKMVS